MRKIVHDKRRIDKIFDELFELYHNEEYVNEYLEEKFKNDTYKIYITVIVIDDIDIEKLSEEEMDKNEYVTSNIGIMLENCRISRFKLEEVTSCDAQVIMNIDTFMQLLEGEDEFGDKFDFRRARALEKIVIDGKSSFTITIIMGEIFDNFSYLLSKSAKTSGILTY